MGGNAVELIMGAMIVARIAPRGMLKNDANRNPEIALVATS